jgi:hypothetical protein
MADPVNAFVCFIGLMVSPSLTLCIILWSLGHPFLGIMALFSGPSVRRYVREKTIDSKGRVIKMREVEE